MTYHNKRYNSFCWELQYKSPVKHSPICLSDEDFYISILTSHSQSKNDLRLVLLSFALLKIETLLS